MKLNKKGKADSPAPPPTEAARGQPVRPDDLTVRPGGTRIGELLVDARLVSRELVIAALTEAQHGPPKLLGQRLVERGVLDERGLAWAVAHQLGIEFADLREITPEPAAVKLMTEAVSRQLTAVALSVRGESLVVAMAFPNQTTVARLREAVGRPLVVTVAARADILRAIGNNYRALTGISNQVRAFEADHAQRKDPARAEAAVTSDDAPVVQVVQMMITQALRDRASDVHVEPQADKVRVRYRIDGALKDVLELPAAMGPVIASRIKIMANMNIVERRRPQDGQIGMQVEERAVDIRVSTTAVVGGGEKVVMRLLDKSRPLYRLGQLGMPDDVAKRYEALLRSPYGMVICAGPTGGGKTTTLYASLGEINTPERNIMTIEDPVEYTFPTINQIQINEQAGITFANGLRSILRQDPDIILVGEVRDVDTARIAVQSALTGHFVLSSLHATDAIAALYRLLDMGIESFLVASSVTAVVAQRLVRRVCTYCCEPYEPSPEELGFLRMFGGAPPANGFVHGAGCNFCAHTGYLDRIGVYELMAITDEVRELILDRGSHDDLRKLCHAQGMRTLQEESVRLVEAGVTTPAEVMRAIYVVGV
jgi:type IV pilus assembly protein PilB